MADGQLPKAIVFKNPKPRVAAILKEINDFLAGTNGETGTEAFQLWAILTSLRGPDALELPGTEGLGEVYVDNSDVESVKISTTGLIRHVCFPDVPFGRLPVTSCEDSEMIRDLRMRMYEKHASYNRHFYGHIDQAFQALGIEWREVNK